MATTTGSGWTQLRQQARSLETQTENLFHTYSQFASITKPPQTPTEEELRLESQLKDLLERRESLISQLSRLLDSEATLTSSALKQNNVARHRESRATVRISSPMSAPTLIPTAHRTPPPREADYMLEERGRVDNSHNMIDGVLSQAYAINENFGIQSETIANINRRIVGAAGNVPGMNYLIGKIGNKKRRDAMILGCFIGFCFLMLLFFH
ncbi:hypothetical protein N7452_009827 [Penicillium brevicompactum]|uniref:Golgi SNAP receptor complex member 1 n=1 Tax=Penicillium brevicompactum TaxID=5074 RepID=A0A9W9QE33_PENBR|nr:hypothetical protein N7452_009827 [Penicillium brevicompactum]